MNGVLLLAAGLGTRFGSDKRKAGLAGGKTLLQTSLQAIAGAELPVVPCLRPGDEELARELQGPGVSPLICTSAARGMGATLAEGVSQLPGDWDGVLVALADMPWIQSQSFRAVARQLQAHALVIPCYQGRRGHPVGFSRRFFNELLRLDGDEGARSLVQAYESELCELELGDPGVCRDVDTVADLA